MKPDPNSCQHLKALYSSNPIAKCTRVLGDSTKRQRIGNLPVPNVLFIVLESVGSNVVEAHMPYFQSISRNTEVI